MKKIPAFQVNHVVIGSGVVGLAIARKLSQYGTTILLEKNQRFGEETSSRNSEVIHSGVYYPPTSFKTRHCVKGQRMLYQFCDKNNVKYLKVGKWIVSTNEREDQVLEGIRKTALLSNVHLTYLSQNQIGQEPALKVHAVLLCPDTGIIDSHSYMDCLQEQFIQKDGILAYRTKFVNMERCDSGGYLVDTLSDNTECTFKADSIINCGGLWASEISKIILKDKYPNDYRTYFCIGHYFKYQNQKILNSPKLIYPAPEKHLQSLGIHLTVDIRGDIKFGPDSKYIDNIDYSFEEIEPLQKKFHAAIMKYIPSVEYQKLVPDYTGIRPKLNGPGQPFRDFIISEESSLGYPGIVNLIGIESPGLTSSLSIADDVASLLGYPVDQNE
jgi:L-2-hydroxyglutarate oxidase LhgO